MKACPALLCPASSTAAAIKIPPSNGTADEVSERVQSIRSVIPEHVRLGNAGDGYAAAGLLAGCEAWFPSIGGTLPQAMTALARPALAGDQETALAESERLRPLWELTGEAGSLRVVAAIAELLELVEEPCLPRPLRGLTSAGRERVREVVERLGLRD